MRRILVTGAGGFIGGHLVKRLVAEGHRVTVTDIKPVAKWWQRSFSTTRFDGRVRCLPAPGIPKYVDSLDLTKGPPHELVAGADDIYHLAADMGGMGFIERNRLRCLLNNTQINTNMVRAILETSPPDPCSRRRVFWSSSACIYPVNDQADTSVTGLPEDLAWHGQPEEGYGEEKLFSESLHRYLREDVGVATRIVRFHNVYGTHTEWRGGREKAPAAICRKIALAKLTGKHTIVIWGDGTRTRSFMDIGDCVEGILRIMTQGPWSPINLGSEEQVSIRQLVKMVADIAGIDVEIECDMTQPQGVAGRNSDNTMIRKLLGWEPTTPLRDGLERLYPWVEQQVKESLE